MTTYMNEQMTYRKRNHLPHLETPGGIYFVTFCLADALGPAFFARQEEKRQKLLDAIYDRYGVVSLADIRAVEKQLRAELFEEMDVGRGSCVLARDPIGGTVANALKYFDRERYRLIAFTVMPNHVHTIFRPAPAIPWWKIVGGWKSFTAKEANRVLARSGTLWQDDNYDRLVRNEQHLENTIGYVLANPVNAGLKDWRWVEQLLFAPYTDLDV